MFQLKEQFRARVGFGIHGSLDGVMAHLISAPLATQMSYTGRSSARPSSVNGMLHYAAAHQVLEWVLLNTLYERETDKETKVTTAMNNWFKKAKSFSLKMLFDMCWDCREHKRAHIGKDRDTYANYTPAMRAFYAQHFNLYCCERHKYDQNVTLDEVLLSLKILPVQIPSTSNGNLENPSTSTISTSDQQHTVPLDNSGQTIDRSSSRPDADLDLSYDAVNDTFNITGGLPQPADVGAPGPGVVAATIANHQAQVPQPADVGAPGPGVVAAAIANHQAQVPQPADVGAPGPGVVAATIANHQAQELSPRHAMLVSSTTPKLVTRKKTKPKSPTKTKSPTKAKSPTKKKLTSPAWSPGAKAAAKFSKMGKGKGVRVERMTKKHEKQMKKDGKTGKDVVDIGSSTSSSVESNSTDDEEDLNKQLLAIAKKLEEKRRKKNESSDDDTFYDGQAVSSVVARLSHPYVV